ncbi:MAG: hypothetical protein K8W52_33475 [Deltaproteobacteria bacterium]|nr:hypothetical protein [Deltaproteobacteria bacterium]
MHRWLLALPVLATGCFTAAISIGGTIDGGGHIGWVGQASVGINAPRGPEHVARMMTDARFYALRGRAHVGVALGADLVTRPLDGSVGHHVGARLGLGGSPVADGRPNPVDVRLSIEAGAAWGSVVRSADPDVDSVNARTIGPTVELFVHSKGDRWRERIGLGARATGELMLWIPQP